MKGKRRECVKHELTLNVNLFGSILPCSPARTVTSPPAVPGRRSVCRLSANTEAERLKGSALASEAGISPFVGFLSTRKQTDKHIGTYRRVRGLLADTWDWNALGQSLSLLFLCLNVYHCGVCVFPVWRRLKHNVIPTPSSLGRTCQKIWICISEEGGCSKPLSHRVCVCVCAREMLRPWLFSRLLMSSRETKKQLSPFS